MLEAYNTLQSHGGHMPLRSPLPRARPELADYVAHFHH